MKEANPEAEATDMLKLLAQGWKDLSEEEQLKWKAEAETDKERYFAECKEAGVEPEVKEAKDEADKHPKKPKGAYFCYAMSERAAVQEVRRCAAAPAPLYTRRSILAALYSPPCTFTALRSHRQTHIVITSLQPLMHVTTGQRRDRREGRDQAARRGVEGAL